MFHLLLSRSPRQYLHNNFYREIRLHPLRIPFTIHNHELQKNFAATFKIRIRFGFLVYVCQRLLLKLALKFKINGLTIDSRRI